MRTARAGLVLLLPVLLAGCGTGGITKGGDPALGGPLFVKGCGQCHVLGAAGTKGTIGPNLDDAFSADRRQKFEQSTIQQVVRDQIELAIPPMPQNVYTGKAADSVAAYVAACAGVQKPGPSCTISAAAGPALPGLAGKGQKLYASLGCQSCHTTDGTKSTGPTFKALFGSKVKLTNGQTVTANDAYLIESIIAPDKQIVSGYHPGIMSAAIKPGSVSQADAKALVAFIKTLK
ncbi:MAG: c-type cytochrome [Gaiellaceae bacterium]